MRVKVTRTDDGTVVEADCQCFGHPMRLHSNPNCPNRRLMPGTNAGTGQPLTFQCAKCRRAKTFDSSRVDSGYGRRIKLTGKRQIINDGHAGARSANYRFEYDCLDCGHRGWSRHRDLERRWEKPELPVWRWQGCRGTEQTVEIICAKNKTAVARAAGVHHPRKLFNLATTGNDESCRVARAEPGVIFWKPIDDRGEWRRSK